MDVYEDTLRALWEAERLMADEGFDKPCLAVLYCYFGSLEGAPTSLKAAKGETKIDEKRLSKNFKILKECGFITVSKAKNSKMIVEMEDIFGNLNLRRLTLVLNSIHTTTTSKTNNSKSAEDEDGGFSESDIRDDEDWKKAEPILAKYFKPFQIHPKNLTKKKRFEALVELLSDKTFDFEAYCKWFRAEKYQHTKFNYGIFLYPGVIEEFREHDEETGKYLKTTTRMENSESHKQGVKDTKEFIKSLLEDEE